MDGSNLRSDRVVISLFYYYHYFDIIWRKHTKYVAYTTCQASSRGCCQTCSVSPSSRIRARCASPYLPRSVYTSGQCLVRLPEPTVDIFASPLHINKLVHGQLPVSLLLHIMCHPSPRCRLASTTMVCTCTAGWRGMCQ